MRCRYHLRDTLAVVAFWSFGTAALSPLPDASSLSVCGSGKEVHTVGNWTFVQSDFPTQASDYHRIASYNCGDLVLSTEHNKHFLCGLTSRSELDRAFRQYSWKWEPKNCYLPRAGRDLENLLETFLTQAEGSRIVYIGDSIAQEQYISIRCLLGQHVEIEKEGVFRTTTNVTIEKRSNPYLVNKTTLEVIDDMTSVGKDTPPIHENSYLEEEEVKRDVALAQQEDIFTWETYSVEDGGSYSDLMVDENVYLVLNTGAHWHGNIKGYSSMVVNVLTFLQKNFRGRRVFYRPMHHGHVGCMDAKGPEAAPDPSRQIFHYNWRILRHYNTLWKIEIDRLNDTRIVYIDTTMMTEERPDSHLHGSQADCFHLCLPGVVDYWNIVMMSSIAYGKR